MAIKFRVAILLYRIDRVYTLTHRTIHTPHTEAIESRNEEDEKTLKRNKAKKHTTYLYRNLCYLFLAKQRKTAESQKLCNLNHLFSLVRGILFYIFHNSNE